MHCIALNIERFLYGLPNKHILARILAKYWAPMYQLKWMTHMMGQIFVRTKYGYYYVFHI